MEAGGRVGNVLTFTIRFLFLILIILVGINLCIVMGISLPDKGYMSTMATIFLSIVLEALPFILIGSFAASLIQIFISEEWIARVISKNRLLGLLSAGLLGLVVPVCECAIIPITRGLMKKGVPAGIAVTFMLAAPIVNPVVLVSTYYAFGGTLGMVLLRAGAGLCGAFIIGIIIDMVYGRKSPLKAVSGHMHTHAHSHDHHNECHEGCCHGHDEEEHSRIVEIIEHTTEEFYDVGKFLILGALISTLLQSAIPRQYLLNAGGNSFLSIAAMMAFAYVVSLCSEADAFVGSTFAGQFTTGSIVAFLILGPMIDIKNTLMLRASFKKGFSALLIALIFVVCYVIAAIIDLFAKGAVI